MQKRERNLKEKKRKEFKERYETYSFSVGIIRDASD